MDGDGLCCCMCHACIINTLNGFYGPCEKCEEPSRVGDDSWCQS